MYREKPPDLSTHDNKKFSPKICAKYLHARKTPSGGVLGQEATPENQVNVPPELPDRLFATAADPAQLDHSSSSASSKTVMLSFRLTEATAEALARAAMQSDQTQRYLLAKALQVAGVEVHSDDLKNRPPHRRRI